MNIYVYLIQYWVNSITLNIFIPPNIVTSTSVRIINHFFSLLPSIVRYR